MPLGQESGIRHPFSIFLLPGLQGENAGGAVLVRYGVIRRSFDCHKVVEGWLLSPCGWPEVLLKFHSTQDSSYYGIVCTQRFRERGG